MKEISEDKLRLVTDMLENPEKYTAESLERIFEDEEVREVYGLMSKVRSAYGYQAAVDGCDVEAEWRAFASENGLAERPRVSFGWLAGNRAASVLALSAASLVAVAVGIGVVFMNSGKDNRETANGNAEMAELSKMAVVAETATEDNDTMIVSEKPVIFENAALEAVMKEVSVRYDVAVRFENNGSAGIRLYFKLNPTLDLDEVVDQLNTFEQIRIRKEGETLIVE